MLAVRGPHGRFEHLLADGTVKIILAEARRCRRGGSLGHGNTSGPLRAGAGTRNEPRPGETTSAPLPAGRGSGVEGAGGAGEDGGWAPGARWEAEAAAEAVGERARPARRSPRLPGPAPPLPGPASAPAPRSTWLCPGREGASRGGGYRLLPTGPAAAPAGLPVVPTPRRHRSPGGGQGRDRGLGFHGDRLPGPPGAAMTRRGGLPPLRPALPGRLSRSAYPLSAGLTTLLGPAGAAHLPFRGRLGPAGAAGKGRGPGGGWGGGPLWRQAVPPLSLCPPGPVPGPRLRPYIGGKPF